MRPLHPCTACSVPQHRMRRKAARPPSTSESSSCGCTVKVSMEFEKLRYTVKVSAEGKAAGPLDKLKGSTRDRDLLHDISGSVSPGSVLAILGPSGAGKTTLLNMLSGKALPGELNGRLLVNGQPMDRPSFRRQAAFVTQDDLMLETQTPREILQFSATLRLPSTVSAAWRTSLVDEIVRLLHLEGCVDTIVGNPSRGGISGGERKRTNVGTELVTNPSVVFLDEPTSGLDAFTALKVMLILQGLAAQGRTVVATIHQPASEIFVTFDRLMLVHQGSCAYFGPRDGALPYFAALGFDCPPNHNPADFLVNLLMRQLYGELDEKEQAAAEFISAWKASPLAVTSLHQPAAKANGAPAAEPGANICMQFVTIARRNLRNYRRDKLGLRARLAQTLIFSSLVGGIFWQLQMDEQAIQDRSGLLFFAILSQMLLGILQVALMFPLERPIFDREFSAGYYSVGAYFSAKVVSEAPFQIVFPTISCAILSAMTGLQTADGKFGVFLAATCLCAYCASSLGFCIGCAAPTPQLAIAGIPVTMLPLLLAGGLLANKDRLDPSWLWLETLSFAAYGYEAIMINEFSARPPRPPRPICLSTHHVHLSLRTAGLTFEFNQTISLPAPTVELVPTDVTLPNGMTISVPMPTQTGMHIVNLTQEVTQEGRAVLDRGGFDSTIGACFVALAIWTCCALALAAFALYTRSYCGRILKELRKKKRASAPSKQESVATESLQTVVTAE